MNMIGERRREGRGLEGKRKTGEKYKGRRESNDIHVRREPFVRGRGKPEKRR